MALLSVRNLRIRFRTGDGYLYAVNDVSFDIEAGQKLGLVGESGSGKSQIALAILGLMAKNAEVEGSVVFDGQELLGASQKALNAVRAAEIAMIFQDPMSALNPYMTIERQLSEIVEQHEGLTRRAARGRVIETLHAVQIPDAEQRLGDYPHHFSGGMRQRIVIAMALICKPRLILADEPTTALDVTVQAQILDLLNEVQATHGTSLLLITHDLGVLAGFCDDVMVLYGGRVMEAADTPTLFDAPAHPYTRGLLRAVPNINAPQQRLTAIPGAPPNQIAWPTACPFAPRCKSAGPDCHAALPPFDGRRACHRPVAELV